MRLFWIIIIAFSITGCGLSARINKKVHEMEVKQVARQHAKEGTVINRDLTFSDFQGTPSSAEGSKHTLGVTSIRLDYSCHSPSNYNSKVYYKFYVSLLFLSNRSWIRHQNDTSVLQHEQIHFDIYKVAAKEFKQKLSSKAYHPVNYRFEMNQILMDIYKKYEVINAQFDISDQRDMNNNALWKVKTKEALEKGKFDIQ